MLVELHGGEVPQTRESGSAILRARFKTAPIKQWEVSRAFIGKRRMEQAGQGKGNQGAEHRGGRHQGKKTA